MMPNNSKIHLTLYMTSLTLSSLVMVLSNSLCYSCVVNKHQLLALSVLCFIVEFSMVEE